MNASPLAGTIRRRVLTPRGLTLAAFSFSKGLFPGLRMGWVQGPPRLLRPMVAVKRFMDLETSALLQAALVEFVANGEMDRTQITDLFARHESAAHRDLGATLVRG